MRRALLLLLLVPSFALAASKRRIVVISDTHLGVGRCTATLWHPYEDFRWQEDFATFLQHLRNTSKATDLVFNGDTFELWQSLTTECQYQDKDLSCTSDDAVKRIERILQEHKPTLASLRAFATDGENRIVLVPGNHDAALLYQDVATKVLNAINAPGRVKIMDAGHWISDDGLVVTAHGHQMDETNAYARWPDAFRTVNATRYLERPWGEQFVQEYYNGFEARYALIDNIAGEAEGIRYGIAAEGKLRTVGHAARFAKFFLFSVSKRQMGDVLATPEVEKQVASTEWDIAAIRKDGPRFFAESVPRDDLARAGIEADVAAGKFDDALPTLEDADINAICNERSALAHAGVSIDRCKAATLSAITHKLTSDTNKRILTYLHQIYDTLPADPAPPGFEVVVFSHTHAARDAFLAQTPEDPWVPSVLNTGAWQRLISGQQLKQLLAERNIKPAKALKVLTHNDLPRDYPYVVIEPYEKHPAGKLHYWSGVRLPTRKPQRCP